MTEQDDTIRTAVSQIAQTVDPEEFYYNFLGAADSYIVDAVQSMSIDETAKRGLIVTIQGKLLQNLARLIQDQTVNQETLEDAVASAIIYALNGG